MTKTVQVDPLIHGDTWDRISKDRAITSGTATEYKQAYQLGMLEALIASMYCDLSAEQRAAFRKRHNIIVEGQP